MDNTLYSHSAIADRPQLSLPGGARLAFYVGLNVERFHIDDPSPTGGHVPDPRNYGQRDYGTRVGIWRMMELFDELRVPVTGIINSEACAAYPEIIQAGIERDWAWVAHGKSNSVLHTGMTREEERVHLAEMFESLDASLPSRPRGWLGPGLTETFNTPELLSDAGFSYLLDWCCDDQPFNLNIPNMISVPYSLDINDIVVFKGSGTSGPEYERLVLDHFEQLMLDSVNSSRVMALPLHTFVTGQPSRFKYLANVLRRIVSTEGVWLCTSDDIAEHFLSGSADDDLLVER